MEHVLEDWLTAAAMLVSWQQGLHQSSTWFVVITYPYSLGGKGTPVIWYNFRVLAAWVGNVQCSGRTMLLVSSAVEGLFIETTLF